MLLMRCPALLAADPLQVGDTIIALASLFRLPRKALMAKLQACPTLLTMPAAQVGAQSLGKKQNVLHRCICVRLVSESVGFGLFRLTLRFVSGNSERENAKGCSFWSLFFYRLTLLRGSSLSSANRSPRSVDLASFRLRVKRDVPHQFHVS